MKTHTIEFHGSKREIVPRQLIVKLQYGSAVAGGGVAVIERILGPGRIVVIHDVDDRGICLIELEGEEGLENVVELLESDDSVIIVVPNDATEQCVIPLPNDPLLSQQWAPTRIDAQAAWEYNTASPSRVLVAVADSGIPMRNGQHSHEELWDRSWFLVGSDFTGSGADLRHDIGRI